MFTHDINKYVEHVKLSNTRMISEGPSSSVTELGIKGPIVKIPGISCVQIKPAQVLNIIR